MKSSIRTFPAPALLIAALAFLLCSGCVSFVASYDATFDGEVSALHRRTEVFFADVELTGSRYPAHVEFYADAFGTLAALRARAELYGAQKNAGTLAILGELETAFRQLEAYDRAGPIRGKGAEALRKTLSIEFAALEQVELHKKFSAGVSAPPSR
ncbi:MAG: hypothetical protein PHC88_04775 [Terrimicrobiaceae bacterium]|nr:hypothetical protein [Terrimicrobiaceae bacterium]